MSDNTDLIARGRSLATYFAPDLANIAIVAGVITELADALEVAEEDCAALTEQLAAAMAVMAMVQGLTEAIMFDHDAEPARSAILAALVSEPSTHEPDGEKQ